MVKVSRRFNGFGHIGSFLGAIDTALRNHMRIVFEEINNASRDKDKILNQIYVEQICSDFYYEDF